MEYRLNRLGPKTYLQYCLHKLMFTKILYRCDYPFEIEIVQLCFSMYIHIYLWILDKNQYARIKKQTSVCLFFMTNMLVYLQTKHQIISFLFVIIITMVVLSKNNLAFSSIWSCYLQQNKC